jgi:hypothetical protein
MRILACRLFLFVCDHVKTDRDSITAVPLRILWRPLSRELSPLYLAPDDPTRAQNPIFSGHLTKLSLNPHRLAPDVSVEKTLMPLESANCHRCISPQQSQRKPTGTPRMYCH